MKKFECKACGNTIFSISKLDEFYCRCGQKLTAPCDAKIEGENGFIDSVRKLYAEAIVKISLLTREIDICLDERNEERFNKVSSELNLYKQIIKTCSENPEFLWMKITASLKFHLLSARIKPPWRLPRGFIIG